MDGNGNGGDRNEFLTYCLNKKQKKREICSKTKEEESDDEVKIIDVIDVKNFKKPIIASQMATTSSSDSEEEPDVKRVKTKVEV